MKPFLSFVLSVVLALLTFGQDIPRDSWPTYNGDLSGKRYSSLSKINISTVGSIGLAWVYRPTVSGNLRAAV